MGSSLESVPSRRMRAHSDKIHCRAAEARMSKAVTNQAGRNTAGPVDAELRGRTYAIPFNTIWEALVTLVSGRLRGWTVVYEDAHAGVIEARVRNLVRPAPAKAMISIGLDANAQTCVDVIVTASGGTGHAETNPRRLRRLIDALDRMLRVRPGQLLDAGAVDPPQAAVDS